MSQIKADRLYGSLNLILLQTLRDGPKHGLGIARYVRETTDDALTVGEGALYPALHRLERDGLVAARWDLSELGRRAKFYSLTDRGESLLSAERARWTRQIAAIHKLFPAGDA